jgi:hypothetical protein
VICQYVNPEHLHVVFREHYGFEAKFFILTVRNTRNSKEETQTLQL